MKKNNTMAVLEKIKALSLRRNFYRDGEKTLVGFSGGADSVTLLHALCTLLGAERIVAVHINHMLRGEEANADEEFCRDFCQKREIPFLSRKIDVNALCFGVGFEEAARNVRYAVFEEIAGAMQCATVSLAHTASDNLETVLFHLCRGAGASGLSGIPAERPLGSGTVVRPLLDVTREEVLAYVGENGLDFRTDSTNGDTAYTRNFIRAEIVPLLQRINPAVEENARSAAASVAALRDYASDSAEKWLRENGGEIRSRAWSGVPEALRYPILEALYRQYGGETLPRAQALALDGILLHRRTGASVALTGNITARLDGEILRFFHGPVENAEKLPRTPLALGENRLSEGVSLYVGEEPVGTFRYRAETRITAEALPTLYARARENGESYRFGGMTRRLKKLLCGEPQAAKNRPLVCDRDGILWLPGFPAADGKTGELPLYYVEK